MIRGIRVQLGGRLWIGLQTLGQCKFGVGVYKEKFPKKKPTGALNTAKMKIFYVPSATQTTLLVLPNSLLVSAKTLVRIFLLLSEAGQIYG